MKQSITYNGIIVTINFSWTMFNSKARIMEISKREFVK